MDVQKAKHIIEMFEKLRKGTVIAEGIHDVRALRLFGVDALTYPRFAARAKFMNFRRAYILTDCDRGGDEKRQKIISALLESQPGCIIDESLGRRMLHMLGVTSVEQIHGPVEELLAKGKQNIQNKGIDLNGENIFGHSKVHGSGEVQHRRTRGQA